MKRSRMKSSTRHTTDHVFFWGQGFRHDKHRQPKHMFSTCKGIKDLKMGWRHVLYIDEETSGLFSWGDTTFGQTGNEQTGDVLMKEQEMRKKASIAMEQLLKQRTAQHYGTNKSADPARDSMLKIMMHQCGGYDTNAKNGQYQSESVEEKKLPNSILKGRGQLKASKKEIPQPNGDVQLPRAVTQPDRARQSPTDQRKLKINVSIDPSSAELGQNKNKEEALTAVHLNAFGYL